MKLLREQTYHNQQYAKAAKSGNGSALDDKNQLPSRSLQNRFNSFYLKGVLSRAEIGKTHRSIELAAGLSSGASPKKKTRTSLLVSSQGRDKEPLDSEAQATFARAPPEGGTYSFKSQTATGFLASPSHELRSFTAL